MSRILRKAVVLNSLILLLTCCAPISHHSISRESLVEQALVYGTKFQVPIQEVNQHHRDMKELLFLPHAGLIQQDKLALYSTEEQQALAAIEQNIK